MNQDQKQKPQQQNQNQNGTEEKDGAGVRFVPSEEPSKLEPTPEKANANH